MDMKRFLKNNICLVSVAVSCLALEGYGLVLEKNGYVLPQEGFGGEVALAALSLREGIFPWNMEAENEMMVMTETKPEVLPVQAAEPKEAPVPETVQASVIRAAAATPATLESAVKAEEVLPEIPEMKTETETETGAQSTESVVTEEVADTQEPAAAEEEICPAETVVTEPVVTGESVMTSGEIWPVFCTVEDDYFSDALFIGDSRIVGVCEYAGIRNATFYAKTSMTIYKMLDSRVETTKDVRTVREGLQNHRFRKIYLMVGLNEVGVGNTDYFINAYREVVQEIRTMQPGALIYIQGIMHVSGHLDRKGGVFNNETINRRNEALAALAEEMHAVYLDVNEAYDDEYGNLPASYTADDVHLKANHYDLWHEYYKTHAVEVPDAAEEGVRTE